MGLAPASVGLLATLESGALVEGTSVCDAAEPELPSVADAVVPAALASTDATLPPEASELAALGVLASPAMGPALAGDPPVAADEALVADAGIADPSLRAIAEDSFACRAAMSLRTRWVRAWRMASPASGITGASNELAAV